MRISDWSSDVCSSDLQAAVLSRICRRVYTIERFKELLQAAEARFAQLRLHNITARHGDGWKGWREQAPFDRIIVTAAAATVPGVLVDRLAAGRPMAHGRAPWRGRGGPDG